MAAPRLSPDQVAALQNRFADLINYEGDDPTAPIDPLTYKEPGGDGLLHVAASRGDVEAVTLLLDAGVDPNIRGEMGYTALHYAGMHGHRIAAEALAARGACIDATNEFGTTPDLAAF